VEGIHESAHRSTFSSLDAVVPATSGAQAGPIRPPSCPVHMPNASVEQTPVDPTPPPLGEASNDSWQSPDGSFVGAVSKVPSENVRGRTLTMGIASEKVRDCATSRCEMSE